MNNLAEDLLKFIEQAKEADKRGDTEAALNAMEQAKRLHQELYYDIWMKHNRSGVVK